MMTSENGAVATRAQSATRKKKNGKNDGSRKWPDLTQLKPDDTISMYMKEMAQVPLLNHAQEKELGRHVTRGRRAAKK